MGSDSTDGLLLGGLPLARALLVGFPIAFPSKGFTGVFPYQDWLSLLSVSSNQLRVRPMCKNGCMDIESLAEERHRLWKALAGKPNAELANRVETLTRQLEEALVEKRRAQAQRRASA